LLLGIVPSGPAAALADGRQYVTIVANHAVFTFRLREE